MGEPVIDLAAIDSLADVLSADAKEGEVTQYVSVEELKRGQFQPRTHIEPKDLQNLSDSIKSQGVIQPIIARRLDDGSLEIVAGERRWRAARMAGLDSVPCIVRDIDDTTALASALVENIDRENMTVVDESLGVSRLVKRTSSKNAAQILGKKAQWVSKRVKIANAPAYVLNFAKSGFSSDVEGLYLLSRLAESQDDAARSLVDLWTKDPTSRVSLRQQVLKLLDPGPSNKTTVVDDEVSTDPQSKDSEGSTPAKPKKKKGPLPPILLSSVSTDNGLLVFETNEGVLKFELQDDAKDMLLKALETL